MIWVLVDRRTPGKRGREKGKDEKVDERKQGKRAIRY